MHSYAVRLSLTDGLSDHILDCGARLTISEIQSAGGFDRLKADLNRLVTAYKKAAEEHPVSEVP